MLEALLSLGWEFWFCYMGVFFGTLGFVLRWMAVKRAGRLELESEPLSVPWWIGSAVVCYAGLVVPFQPSLAVKAIWLVAFLVITFVGLPRLGLKGVEFREKGVLLGRHSFRPWDKVERYRWSSHGEVSLKFSGYGPIGFTVDEAIRDRVDRYLSERGVSCVDG